MLRALVPRVAGFGAFTAVLLLGHAIAVHPSAHVTALPAAPAVESSWNFDDLAAFPGCVPSSRWPTGTPAKEVVVQPLQGGEHRKAAFARAWRLNHDDTVANDLWVVGVCHDQR